MNKDKSISLNRAKILRIIKDNEPIAIHELQDKIKLPRSTVIHHLEQLKIRGLILEKSSLELKQKKEIGSPVYLVTNKANPLLKSTLVGIDAVITFLR